MMEIREACNLSDEEYAARRVELREGLIPLARGRENLSDGLALLFDRSAPIRAQLEAFVAFERECCPGLGFSVHDTAGALRLEIRGVDPNASDFAGLGLDAVVSADQATPKGYGVLRVIRAVGLGGVVSLLLCCALPIGIAALVGAKLAAPLGVLDNPWVISIGAIGFAATVLLRERRHARASNPIDETNPTTTASGCSC